MGNELVTDPQACWDRLLLLNFIRNFNEDKSKYLMVSLANLFEDMTGVDPATLKRTPRAPHHKLMRPGRFVCGHLPRLARIMIDKNKTEADVPELMENLKRWSIDTVERDNLQQRESSEKQHSRDKYIAARMAYAAECEFREKNSGRGGKMTRQTRTKTQRGHRV